MNPSDARPPGRETSGEAWEKARTKICRDLSLSAELGVDTARWATGLDELDELESLTKLRAAVDARIPVVDLPEALLEVRRVGSPGPSRVLADRPRSRRRRARCSCR